MPARLIGRAGNETGIETVYNEGFAAVWFAHMPFGPTVQERKCVCLQVRRQKRKLDSLSPECFPHLCLPLVTVWNKSVCLADWTKTLAYLYAAIKRQKASGRKQNIITGMCPKWMLHLGCNGTSVTLQVNSCADNHSVVWR